MYRHLGEHTDVPAGDIGVGYGTAFFAESMLGTLREDFTGCQLCACELHGDASAGK